MVFKLRLEQLRSSLSCLESLFTLFSRFPEISTDTIFAVVDSSNVLSLLTFDRDFSLGRDDT